MEDRERRPASETDESTEDTSAEDVELHRRKTVANTESPTDEGQSDDDVELHRRSVQ